MGFAGGYLAQEVQEDSGRVLVCRNGRTESDVSEVLEGISNGKIGGILLLPEPISLRKLGG